MIQVGIPEGMGIPAVAIQVDASGHVILSADDVDKIAQRMLALKGDCPCCGYPKCGHTHGPDPSKQA